MSSENCISINSRTVQKEIFVGNGSIQKIPFRQFFCRIQSQDDQESGSPAAATTHIAQTSGVTQIVDLTNKGMGNHYLRDVHGFRTAV